MRVIALAAPVVAVVLAAAAAAGIYYPPPGDASPRWVGNDELVFLGVTTRTPDHGA